MEASFPVLPILHCAVRTLCKNKCAFLSNFVSNSALKIFVAIRRHHFVNKTLQRSSLLTTTTTVDASQAGGWAHEVYYTPVDRNALTPLFRHMVDLLCNLFLQGYSSWHNLDWQRVARSLCGAQLLVLSTMRDPSKTQTVQVGSLKLCKKMWKIYKISYKSQLFNFMLNNIHVSLCVESEMILFEVAPTTLV